MGTHIGRNRLSHLIRSNLVLLNMCLDTGATVIDFAIKYAWLSSIIFY
jgi:hypothetical protein